MMRIESNGSGPRVMEGERVAMLRIKEVVYEGRGATVPGFELIVSHASWNQRNGSGGRSKMHECSL